MTDDSSELPKRTPSDVAHSLTKAGINLVPFVGGAAAELFALIIGPPLNRRRDKWLADLAENLKKLEERVHGFKLESLAGNEVFISAFLQASQTALRTHEQEKLEALRNALMHIAITKSLKEDMQIFFLGLVDAFTVTHIEILRLFGAQPGSQGQRRQELGKRPIITDSIVMDLNAKGLLQDPRPYVARSRESAESLVFLGWKLSDLGREFVNFISKPYDT